MISSTFKAINKLPKNVRRDVIERVMAQEKA